MNFNFEEIYILENEWVFVCLLIKEDEGYLFFFFLNEFEFWIYLFVFVNGKENLKNYI